jgi:hypothetical protein
MTNFETTLHEPRIADFQSAVSQGFHPAGRSNTPQCQPNRQPADWKSAIQQIGNLRYDGRVRGSNEGMVSADSVMLNLPYSPFGFRHSFVISA